MDSLIVLPLLICLGPAVMLILWPIGQFVLFNIAFYFQEPVVKWLDKTRPQVDEYEIPKQAKWLGSFTSHPLAVLLLNFTQIFVMPSLIGFVLGFVTILVTTGVALIIGSEMTVASLTVFVIGVTCFFLFAVTLPAILTLGLYWDMEWARRLNFLVVFSVTHSYVVVTTCTLWDLFWRTGPLSNVHKYLNSGVRQLNFADDPEKLNKKIVTGKLFEWCITNLFKPTKETAKFLPFWIKFVRWVVSHYFNLDEPIKAVSLSGLGISLSDDGDIWWTNDKEDLNGAVDKGKTDSELITAAVGEGGKRYGGAMIDRSGGKTRSAAMKEAAGVLKEIAWVKGETVRINIFDFRNRGEHHPEFVQLEEVLESDWE